MSEQQKIRLLPLTLTVLTLHCLSFITVCIVQYYNILDLESKIIDRRLKISYLTEKCGNLKSERNSEEERIERALKDVLKENGQVDHIVNRLKTRQTLSGSPVLQSIITAQLDIIKRYCTNETKICIPGTQGLKGLKGSPGEKGVKGDNGIFGDKGTTGVNGPKGLKGERGDVGIKGKKGVPGPVGPPGLKGLTGDKGQTGAAGSKGDKGSPGLQGDPGERGDAGATGQKGAPGIDGATGDPGDRGLNGTKGLQGDRGPPGPNARPKSCACLTLPSFLSNQTVVNTHYGSNVTLDCSVNVTDGVTVSFHKVGTIRSSCRPASRFPIVNGSLTISSVEPVDTGYYQCIVTSYVGTINKTITVQTTDGLSTVFNCDFESQLCNWKQSNSDDSNWLFNQGETYTSGTGPHGDHTTGNGHYIYLDASKLSANQNAQLESMFVQTTQPHCLSLWTHMYGTDVGSLIVSLQTCGQVKRLLKESGNKGDSWKHVLIDIPPHPDGMKVIIESTRGGGVFGDIAVDDIKLTQGICALVQPHFYGPSNETIVANIGSAITLNCSGEELKDITWEKGTQCTNTLSTNTGVYTIPNVKLTDAGKYVCSTKAEGKVLYKTINLVVTGNTKCDFERDLCDWTQAQTDTFEWTRQYGNTPSPGTGPSHDHTTNTSAGHYLFIEASGRSRGDNAQLLSPVLPADVYVCFKFWYFMYGTDINVLNILTKDCSGTKTANIDKTIGAQGDKWHQKCLHLGPKSTDYNLIIEAVRGNDYSGDISIDDLELSVSKTCSCSKDEIHRTCDFEHGICEWHQPISGNINSFEWTQNQGSTNTMGTGTLADHTTGRTSGHYVYADASSGSVGDKATFVSTPLPFGESLCLSLWYNMYGSGSGTLNIYTKDVGSGVKKLVWAGSGYRGRNWVRLQHQLPPQSQQFEILIEAVKGSSSTSDIAIDDITINSGRCA